MTRRRADSNAAVGLPFRKTVNLSPISVPDIRRRTGSGRSRPTPSFRSFPSARGFSPQRCATSSRECRRRPSIRPPSAADSEVAAESHAVHRRKAQKEGAPADSRNAYRVFNGDFAGEVVVEVVQYVANRFLLSFPGGTTRRVQQQMYGEELRLIPVYVRTAEDNFILRLVLFF